MQNSKIFRELLRLILQITTKCPFMFTKTFTSRVKTAWNMLQYKEGLAVNPVRHKDTRDFKYADLSYTSGRGETVHPSVLYFPRGFGTGKWKYLMTVTPFPMGITYFENPEFIVSDDGISWKLPDIRAHSPLVPPPSDWIGYNSDPVLFYDDGTQKLSMFYREVREEKDKLIISIYMISTEDGVEWSRPSVVYAQSTPKSMGGVLLSPAVLIIDGTNYVWYVEKNNERYILKRAQSPNFATLEKSVTCVISGMPDGFSLWHIDVKDGGYRLIMAACITDDTTKVRSIVFAESFDCGASWHIFSDRLEPCHKYGQKSLYKASIIKEDNSDSWKLYYSYNDFNGHWFTVVRQVKL